MARIVSDTHYPQRVSDAADLEDGSGSDVGHSFGAENTCWRPRNLVGVAVGLACVVACVVVAATSGSGTTPDVESGSARALLESQGMIDVATSNIMKTSGKLISPRHEEQVRGMVAGGLKNITNRIRIGNPEAYEQLNSLFLTTEQRHGVLHVVGHMSDPRVQQIGFEVAKTVKEGMHEGPEGVKRRLVQRFKDRAPQLKQLRDEIFPAALRRLEGTDRHPGFDPDSMRIIKDFPQSWKLEQGANRPAPRLLVDDWDSWGEDSMSSSRNSGSSSRSSMHTQSNPSSSGDISQSGKRGSMLSDDDMQGMSTKLTEGLGVVAGLVEQCRVFLDQIDFCGESFGVNLKIPYWAKSLVGGLSFVTELSDCVSRADDNQVKMMMCPMKYASAFTDFMSMVDNLMGVNNGHFWESLKGGGTSATAGMSASAGTSASMGTQASAFGQNHAQTSPSSAYAQPQGQHQTSWNWS
mmetsp:Transcript_86517/g.242267  ORF Transcript_86517/g.242267 Transcript_86517/m.242267 type:complete len:465 (-) Transcript_86517:148-1542(-)